jgi:hypothetical protein
VRYQQPQGPVQLVPKYGNAVLGYAGGLGNNISSLAPGSLTTGIGASGIALVGTGGGTGATVVTKLPTTNIFTLIAVVDFAALGVNVSVLDYDTTSPRCFQFVKTAANAIQLIRFDTAGNPYFATTSTAVTAANTSQTIIARSNGAAMDVWLNGGGRASAAISNTPLSLGQTLFLGGGAGGAGNTPTFQILNGKLYGWAVIPAALSDAEIASISANPWQLFVSPKVVRFAAAVGGVTVAPSKGSVALTGKIPAVTRTASVVIAPVKGAMALIGKLPTLAQTANQVVAPVKGSIAFTGKQATVFQSASGTIQASKGALTYAGKVPALLQTANVVLNPAKSLLSYSGHVATIAQTANQAIAPIKGALTYAGKLPTVTQIAGANIAPFGVSLSYAGKAPIVTRTTSQLFAPAKGAIIYKGYPPSILRSSALIASARRTAKLTGRNFGAVLPARSISAALPSRNQTATYDPSET